MREIYLQGKYWSVPLISRNFLSLNKIRKFPLKFFHPIFLERCLYVQRPVDLLSQKKIENLLSHSPSRFWDCCLIKRGVQLLLLPGINCFVLDSQLGLKKAWSKEVPLVPAFLMTATDRISKILFFYSTYIYFFRWKQIINFTIINFETLILNIFDFNLFIKYEWFENLFLPY